MKTRTSELALFAAVLALANLPLLFGRVCEPLLFEPARVAAGEWWRVLTGPLVHVSAYHLLLDAGAFLMLYRGLREPSRTKRLVLVAAPAAGSLLISLPSLLAGGGSLCGLSGVAHGLLAVSALELMDTRDRTTVRIGAVGLFIVAGKSVIEALTGHVLFASLHLGDVATPVAICHLGGVLGGLLAYTGFAASERLAVQRRTKERVPRLEGETLSSRCPPDVLLTREGAAREDARPPARSAAGTPNLAGRDGCHAVRDICSVRMRRVTPARKRGIIVQQPEVTL